MRFLPFLFLLLSLSLSPLSAQRGPGSRDDQKNHIDISAYGTVTGVVDGMVVKATVSGDSTGQQTGAISHQFALTRDGTWQDDTVYTITGVKLPKGAKPEGDVITYSLSIVSITPSDGSVACTITNGDQMKNKGTGIVIFTGVTIVCDYAVSGVVSSARDYPITLTALDERKQTSDTITLTSLGAFRFPNIRVSRSSSLILTVTSPTSIQQCVVIVPSLSASSHNVKKSFWGTVFTAIGNFFGIPSKSSSLSGLTVSRPVSDINITCAFSITTLITSMGVSQRTPIAVQLVIGQGMDNITQIYTFNETGTSSFNGIYVPADFSMYTLSIISSPLGEICDTNIMPNQLSSQINCRPLDIEYTTSCISPIVTSQAGTSVTCMITIITPQIIPLSYQFKSNDTNVVMIENDKGIITPDAIPATISVTIRGVYSSSFNTNQTYCIALNFIRNNMIVSTSTCIIYGMNIAISTPIITKIQPSHVALLGRMVNVTGNGFHPKIKAIVGGIATDVTYISNTSLTLFAPAAPNSTWISTYRTLVLINPDLGTTSCPSACPDTSNIFYSETLCPQEGMYGEGFGCQPCPKTAICPGGNRIWPGPGYWSSDEFAKPGQMSPCQPPATERCVGGRKNTCGEGYQGDMCSQCTMDHYLDGITCRSCRSNMYDGELEIVILVTLAFILSMGFGIACMSNAWLDRYFITIVTFQQIVAVYGSMEPFLPTASLYLYKVLRIFLFDYSFVKPDCLVGKYTFISRFYASIILTLIVIIYFLFCSFLYTRYRRYHNKREKPRYIRSIILAIHVMYLQQTIKILQVLNCKPIAATGKNSLVIEQGQECYDGTHGPAAALGWILLFTFSISIPCYYLYKLYKLREHMIEYVVRNRWGFLYRGLQTKYWWYRICIYGFSFLFALQIAVFEQSIIIQMTVATLILCIKVCFSLIFRPMKLIRDNLYSIIAGNASLTSTSILLFMVNSPIAGGIFITLTCLVTIISCIVGWYMRRQRVITVITAHVVADSQIKGNDDDIKDIMSDKSDKSVSDVPSRTPIHDAFDETTISRDRILSATSHISSPSISPMTPQVTQVDDDVAVSPLHLAASQRGMSMQELSVMITSAGGSIRESQHAYENPRMELITPGSSIRSVSSSVYSPSITPSHVSTQPKSSPKSSRQSMG